MPVLVKIWHFDHCKMHSIPPTNSTTKFDRLVKIDSNEIFTKTMYNYNPFNFMAAANK